MSLKAIISGLPINISRRITSVQRSGQLSYREGWKIKIVVALRKHFIFNINELNGNLQNIGDDQPLILAFKPSDSSQQSMLLEQVEPFFRLRWLKNNMACEQCDLGALIEHINDILEIEELWSSKIRPDSIHSPLLLPEKCFTPESYLRDLWDAAKRATLPRLINHASDTINNFYQHHEQKNESQQKIWVDKSSLIFDRYGSRHGRAPFPYYWKFSYSIPDGFHFDVSGGNKRKIKLCDCYGKEFEGTYLNVDPHGRIR